MSPQKIFQRWPRALQAVFIMLIAIFMISVMNLCAKLASPYHDPIEIVFYRGVFGLICLMAWLIFSRRFDLLKTSRPWTHAGRSIVGTIGVTMVFWAYALMPMADVSALLLTSSLFVTALSAILLKERVGVWRWSAVVIGLLGALIVAAPTGMSFNAFGFGVAMGAAITVAFVSIFLRALGKTEHAFTTVFYFVLTGTLASGCYMIFKGTPPDPAAWWALVGTGATGLLSLLLKTQAYKFGEASFLSPCAYTSVIWGILFGFAFWKDIPSATVLLGSAVIIISNIVIVVREHKLKPHSREIFNRHAHPPLSS